jgi:hypothetical protein
LRRHFWARALTTLVLVISFPVWAVVVLGGLLLELPYTFICDWVRDQ